MRRRFPAARVGLLGLVGSVGLLAIVTLAPATGCGSGGAGGEHQGGPDASEGHTTILHPDADPLPGETECKVVEVTDLPEDSFAHVPTCDPVTYATNPPSGGDHWAIWAAYKKYTQPVPREMYVHDLEHGGVVLAYKCAGECPDVVAALESVFDSATDPLCTNLTRMVLTPDPLLDTPIAAAAWGAIYTATCLDPKSLKAFVKAHQGHGREAECSNGVDLDDAGAPCGD